MGWNFKHYGKGRFHWKGDLIEIIVDLLKLSGESVSHETAKAKTSSMPEK